MNKTVELEKLAGEVAFESALHYVKCQLKKHAYVSFVIDFSLSDDLRKAQWIEDVHAVQMPHYKWFAKDIDSYDYVLLVFPQINHAISFLWHGEEDCTDDYKQFFDSREDYNIYTYFFNLIEKWILESLVGNPYLLQAGVEGLTDELQELVKGNLEIIG